MNAMLVYTACSCSVREFSIWQISPTVACTVSSMVKPVKTRMVSVRSSALSLLFHAGRSLDSGTFSGNQKFEVKRFQTSRSFSSVMWFQFTGRRRAAGSKR
jgi:hypothetical protein